MDEEVEVWDSIVDNLPADWFSPPNTPLLSQYCRHIVACRRIGEMLKRHIEGQDFTVAEYDRLLGMQARESTIIKGLAASMRLAQQSALNWRGHKTAKAAHKPWD